MRCAGDCVVEEETVEYLELFKAESDVILANRFDEEALGDVVEKVYTRDLFRDIRGLRLGEQVSSVCC